VKKILIYVFFMSLFSLPVTAGIVSFLEEPDTLLASNIVTDIVEHEGEVWLATGEGVNFSLDDGETWLLYDKSNGLVSENLSAIYSINGRIWVATNHDTIIDYYEENYRAVLSDGLSYSDDMGDTWTQINFGADGLNIPFVWGGDLTIYDITGHYDDNFFEDPVDWLFFTAYAGGLLASQDGGLNWRRLFPGKTDSIFFVDTVQEYLDAPENHQLYFSCVADTSHGDSVFLWSGTAGGVFQYVYAKPQDKLYSTYLNRVAFCDTCTDSENNYMFVGGDKGLVRHLKTGGKWTTRLVQDGMPGPLVTALIDFRGRLLIGTADMKGGSSTGLAYSTDMGETIQTLIGYPEFEEIGSYISDFAVMGERLYMAAHEAGLFVSLDSGVTWENILMDSLATNSPINYVNGLDVTGDTLWVGTDSGFVSLTMDGAGAIDSMFHAQFVESDSSSARIIRLRVQEYGLGTVETEDDSTAIWTIHRPMTVAGMPFVGRSVDGGTTWDHYQVESVALDVNFIRDTAIVVGEDGIRLTEDGSNPEILISIFDKDIVYDVEDSTYRYADSLNRDTITFFAVDNDTLVMTTSRGIAVSFNGFAPTGVFDIFRGNIDSLAEDFVINHTANNSLFPVVDTIIDGDPPETTYVLVSIDTGITGNFIQSMGVQYPDDGPARIWVSGNRTDTGFAGLAVGRYEFINGFDASDGYVQRWHAVNFKNFAWNFAFLGDTVFAATDAGLLVYEYTDELNRDWDTVEFVDSLGREVLLPGVSVYGVEIIDSFLWVGSEDGTVRINLNDFSDQKLHRVVDFSDEVYAFPVPFSPLRTDRIRFHFNPPRDTYATVKVYDFAMNLVSTPLDNEWVAAGPYPPSDYQGATWDGRNDRGDIVAVGVYYFKVEFSSGDVHWGKLAVIP